MWMTANGVTHTNHHAGPAEVVTQRMWASLVSIADREGRAAALAVDEGFVDLLEDVSEGRVDLSTLTPGLEDEWSPDEYLDGEFSTSEDVRTYIDTVSIDWRFEAYGAVADILWDLTEVRGWRRFAGVFRRR